MKFKNLILLIIFALLIGCGGGKKFAPALNTIPNTGSEFKLLQEQGDQEFAKMHFMGWYNAANCYRKALELKKNASDIKEKLFFTYFLKALREPLYFIDNSESRRETHYWAEELNRSISTKNPFSGIVVYLFGEKDPTSPEITEASILELKNAADTDYKYFLYLKYSGLRMDTLARQKEADIFLRLYPASNLRYFVSSQFNDMNSAIETYPDFFEILLVRGDLAYQAMNIENARRDYLKVVEINRAIPAALVGVGNVYYDIGLIQKALEYYEEAVKTSHEYFTALFKKGVCLHDLGRYDESNNVMDIVAKDGVFEKGDAFYYIALNYFNLKNFPLVETNIRNAELIIPDSFRLNFLAGLFYYQSERYAKSRGYFKKANEIASTYPECYYYQGLMDLKERKMKTALENFLLAAVFYNGFLRDEYLAIGAIAEKDYTPELKLRIKQLREKRLQEDAKNSIQKLEGVLDVFRNNNTKAIMEIRRIVQYIKENYLLKINP